MNGAGDSNDTSVFDRLAAWEEQKRREAEEFATAIAAEEQAAEATLAKIRKARELLSPSALRPAPSPAPPSSPASLHLPAAQPDNSDDPFSAARKRELRRENLHVIINAVLTERNDLTFHELLSMIQKIKQDARGPTVHSALSRLRDKSVRFDGTRGGMTYHLLTEADAGRVQANGAVHRQRSMDATAEHIVRLLREQPGRPIKEIAASVYGDDGEKSQNNVRSNLSKLLRMNPPRVVNVGRGQWEAIAEK